VRKFVASGRTYARVDARGRMRLLPDYAVEGQLLVTVRTRGVVGAQEARQVASALGGRVAKFHPRFGLALVELPPHLSVLGAQARCLALPEVVHAEPNGFVYAAATPNDPLFAQQYHLPQIEAPPAWDLSTGSPSTLIAVIDAGIDDDHPDLAPHIFHNTADPVDGLDNDSNGYVDDYSGWDFLEGDNDPNPTPNGQDEGGAEGPDENVSHGTLAAGTIAAVTNNGAGVAGVSWSAQLLNIKVLPDDQIGTTIEMVVDGIEYALSFPQIAVINLSLGGPYSTAWDDVVAAVHAQGVALVAAAGNNSVRYTASTSTWDSLPCNDGPNLGVDNYVIGVTSVNSLDVRSYFAAVDASPYSFVDFAAPGEDIFGTFSYFPAFPIHQELYGSKSGTSFSTPQVSGAIAVLRGLHPGWSIEQIVSALKAGADNIDRFNPADGGHFGAGRLNLARAVGLDLPPKPATDVSAEDTPGDAGNSITVHWTISRDDDALAMDVTGYDVWRAPAASGPFEAVATALAPGTTTFEDQPVPNGVPYFYKVRTHDAQSFTDSNVVGPATAGDDDAPLPVTDLVVTDHPGDDGGAIDLAWPGYTPPPDFHQYRVYRSQVSFTSVLARVPLTTIEQAETKAYTDSTAQDAESYYYAVTAVDESGNERKSVTPAGPVQSYPNTPHTFPAGISLLSVPAVPPDNDDVADYFGLDRAEFQMARWHTPGSDYLRYQPGYMIDPLRLHHGAGYFVFFPSQWEVTPHGTPAPPGDLSVWVEPGWQMLGNPFFFTWDFGDSSVTYNSVTYNLGAADALNLVQGAAWTYDNVSSSYHLVSDLYPGGDRGIAPWHGFWFRAFEYCSLSLRRIATGLQVAGRSFPQKNGGGWFARVEASCEGHRDTDNFWGVSSSLATRGQLANPPMFGPIDLYFPTDARGAAGPWATALRADVGPGTSWTFEVQCREPNAEVQIRFPDLSRVPRRFRPILTDLAGGRTTYLRTSPAYRYNSGPGGGKRRFRLDLGADRGRHLAVSGLSAVPVQAGGAEIRFVLSRSADCDLKVLNIAGRTVRVLETAHLRVAGTHIALWDGRSDVGTAVPAGRYLLRLRAVSDDGQVVNQIGSVTIHR